MCHSPAATAVCMTGPDSRAVVIPGRRSSSERNIITNSTANTAASSLPSRYSKLVDYHNIKLNNNNNDNRRHHHHRHRDQSQAKLSGGANNNNMIIVKSEQQEEQAVNNDLTLISGGVSTTNTNTNNSDRQIVLRDDLNISPTSGIDSLPHSNVLQVIIQFLSFYISFSFFRRTNNSYGIWLFIIHTFSLSYTRQIKKVTWSNRICNIDYIFIYELCQLFSGFIEI